MFPSETISTEELIIPKSRCIGQNQTHEVWAQIAPKPYTADRNRSLPSKWPSSKKWQFTVFTQHPQSVTVARLRIGCEECGKAPWLARSTEFITIHSPSLEFCQNTVAWFISQTEMPMKQRLLLQRREDILLYKYIYWQGGFRLKALDGHPRVELAAKTVSWRFLRQQLTAKD